VSARQKVLKARGALLNGSGKLAYFEERGLEQETVRAAYVGYETEVYFPGKNGRDHKGPAFTYPCIGKSGGLLGVHYKSELRNDEGKRWQRWDGFANDLPPKRHGKKPQDPAKVIPFGMETLDGLEPGSEVILFCGEEDALAGRQAGRVSLSQPGAGLLEPAYAREFAGLKVVVFYDAGEEREARKDALKLRQAGAQSVRVVKWPKDVPNGADVNGRLLENPEGFEGWLRGMADEAEPLDADNEGVTNRKGEPDRYSSEVADASGQAEPGEAERREPPNGAELLETLVGFIRRYVALGAEQALLSALWIVHTHALDAADTTPYLNITSAEKRSGKTRLLEVLSLVVARPWLTGRVTSAVLVRKTSAEQPTLLLDESDAAFKGDREYAETLRGVLNAGFRRGGVASLCVGQGANLSYEDFPVYCPKAIAGIGMLPDTVADRSIPIELRRRRLSEKVERFRLRKVGPEALPIRCDASSWAAAHLDKLSTAEPSLPEELDDRAQDIIEPLLAIADEVGGEWPEHPRRAGQLHCSPEKNARTLTR
jgi:hypothetical protein